MMRHFLVALFCVFIAATASAQTILIGDNTPGGSSSTLEQPTATRFTASSSGTLATISVYVATYAGGGANVTMALISDWDTTGYAPENTLASCTSAQSISASATWYTCALTCTVSCAVTSGTIYWLGVWVDNTNATIAYEAGTTSTPTLQAQDTTYHPDPFPTWTTPIFESNLYDRQYAVYGSTAGGGGGGGGGASGRCVLTRGVGC